MYCMVVATMVLCMRDVFPDFLWGNPLTLTFFGDCYHQEDLLYADCIMYCMVVATMVLCMRDVFPDFLWRKPPNNILKILVDYPLGGQLTQETSKRLHAENRKSKPWITLSRDFTSEGGVLQDPQSDVKLTVPPGAVPKGESVAVRVRVFNNVRNHCNAKAPDKTILGPVVEMAVNRNNVLQDPVKLSIPLCRTPRDYSDIDVMSKVGGHFEKVLNDMGTTYNVRGNFVDIITDNFTTFRISGEKTEEIDEVLLTLGASKSKRTTELVLMSHVNLLSLKDFKQQREKHYPRGMEEIYSQKVYLPQNTRQQGYPGITINLKLKEDSPWRVDNGKQVTLDVNGSDVFPVKHMYSHASTRIKTFLLESVEDESEASFSMDVRFKPEGPDHIRFNFVGTYPAATSDDVSFPLWDQRNPREHGLVKDVYPGLVDNKLPQLTKALVYEMPHLWDHLISLKVVTMEKKEQFQVEKGEETIQRLLDHLKEGPMWRCHGFLKALANTDNDHLITMMGCDPKDYDSSDY